MARYAFLPTGEFRCPQEGEWFLGVDDVRRTWFNYQDKNEFPIYQRYEIGSEEFRKALAAASKEQSA